MEVHILYIHTAYEGDDVVAVYKNRSDAESDMARLSKGEEVKGWRLSGTYQSVDVETFTVEESPCNG